MMSFNLGSSITIRKYLCQVVVPPMKLSLNPDHWLHEFYLQDRARGYSHDLHKLLKYYCEINYGLNKCNQHKEFFGASLIVRCWKASTKKSTRKDERTQTFIAAHDLQQLLTMLLYQTPSSTCASWNWKQFLFVPKVMFYS